MKQRRRSTAGQSVVEFALILPILLVLFFGIIDFGMLLSKQHVINQMAKELTREASVGAEESVLLARGERFAKFVIPISGKTVSHESGATIFTYSTSEGESVNPDTSVYVTITPSLNGRDRGEIIEVAVTHNYVPLTPILDFVVYWFGREADDSILLNSTYSTMVEQDAN
ncbi:TadE/TadG family type IV pilus assembly protein [Brevibacillus dissolubilis]|uniref:TadE/TadG family type IV pilus assembly protein n=1 Tax=Brevibacillus dissolubilis TaxID=1844116 RepID=UPI00111720A3|nr:TadE/TadG family type IV pilus assembly protein [Brevibacillus dissolubilis]